LGKENKITIIMHIKSIINEINQLPLDKRYKIIEQTLKSIKKDKKIIDDQKLTNNTKIKTIRFSDHFVNEKSLADDWLSEEDNRWDKLL
jgi:hypothetical protein